MPYPIANNTSDSDREDSSTLDMSLMFKMVLAVRGFRGHLDERLRKIGHSTSRMETLSAIKTMQGPKSQSDVAKRLRVEGATVTRMVDILSKEGLVERTPSPTDRRVNLLSITAAGETVLADLFGAYDRTKKHVLADISSEQMIALHNALDAMISQLDLPRLDLPRLDLPEKAEIAIEDLPGLDRLRDKIIDPEA